LKKKKKKKNKIVHGKIVVGLCRNNRNNSAISVLSEEIAEGSRLMQTVAVVPVVYRNIGRELTYFIDIHFYPRLYLCRNHLLLVKFRRAFSRYLHQLLISPVISTCKQFAPLARWTSAFSSRAHRLPRLASWILARNK